MPSKIQVDQIAGATGSTVTLPSGQTLDLSSGTVTLPNSAVNLTTKVTGTLPVANGGTGLTSLGTANQVLAVNSGATALAYTTLTSDFVKLNSSGAVSGNIISVDGYFSSTYKNYIVKVLGARGVSASGNRLNLRVNTSGSNTSSAVYAYSTYYNVSSGTFTGSWSAGFTATLIDIGYIVTNTTSTEDAVASFTINFYDPLNTNNFKPISYEGAYFDQTGAFVDHKGSACFRSTTALTGFTLGHANFSGSGTIYADDIIIYGLK